MSNKTHSKKKVRNIHITGNKKSIPPPTIYCDECNSIIDEIDLEHYILDGRDVCNLCYHKIIQNQPQTVKTPFQPQKIKCFMIPPLPVFPFIHNINTDTNTTIDNNTNAKNPKTNNKHKTNKKNKSSNNNNKKSDDEKSDDDDDYDDERYIRYSNDDNSSRFSNGNSNGTSNGNLFFERLLSNLRNISDSPSNQNTDKNDKESDDEEDDINEDELDYEWLGANISNIDDLIELGKSFHSRKRKRYNLNLKQLSKLVEPLTELKNMIGMEDVKKIVFDQIIYYIQNLDTKNVDMLHTVIVGPPGVGKTQLTHIIAKIYNRLGFLKTDKVICAKRDDLIGEYIGQTAPKTRKVLERALGGVLLLDEIYSLSPTSERDFAREAIDMINMYLSEHAHDLVCVVAGYKKPTYEKFFSQNEGLARRFTHHFEIKGYSPEELTLIFKKYLEEQKWQLGTSIEEITPVIKDNMDIFPNYGGDMTTLFACCKKTHSRRLLNIPTEEELIKTKKNIMLPDIIDAIKLFKEIKEKHSSTAEEDKAKYKHMYC